MAEQKSNNDLTRLKNLVPLNTLTDAQLANLQKQVEVEQVKKGDFLFREGDTDHQNIYLLSGAVALLSGRVEVDVVSSGTQTARFALAHQIPRKHSARAKCPVSYVRIDSSLLSDMLARNQSASYEVDESADSNKGDWMGQLLQSPIFQQIPPANLQRVMMSMSEMPVSADEVIIQQGDEGDYFYLISSGQCRVTRQASSDQPPVELAVLSAGQGFGEEALLSDKPRSSTVTMITDGELVRLSKQDFVELVKQPVSNHIDYTQACQMLQENAVWIDVRTPEEYAQAHLPQAINLPFFSLRFQTPNLAEDHVYLVYGAEVGQTATAAYLLMERGYEVLAVIQEWQEIADQAGLGVTETAGLQGQESEFASDLAELNEVEPVPSETSSDRQPQQADSTVVLTSKLDQYKTEQKLLKQALAVAKRKLEQAKEDASERDSSQELVLRQLREQLTTAESVRDEFKHLVERERKQKSLLEESENKLKQLENELKQARSDMEQAEKSLAGHAQSSRQAAESRAVLEQELAELKQQHKTVEAHLAEAEEQKAQQLQELAALEEKLELVQRETTSLNQEHAQLQQAHEAALGRIEALEEQKAKEIADLEEQTRNLEQTLESANVEAQAVREAFEESQNELQSIEQQREEVQGRFEQEHQTAEFLRRSLETAENAVEISDTMVEENNREIARLSRQIVDLQSEHSDLQADKRAMEQRHQEAVAELQDALDCSRQEQAQSVAQQQQERHRLQTEKAHLETELAQTQTTLQANQQAYDATIAERQHRIDQLENELLTLRAEAELSVQNQADAQEQESALQKAREEITRLTSTIEGLREVQLEMESQLSEDSTGELQSLRLALEHEEKKRQQAEQVAKQVDVLRRERAVQETAVEMLGEDIENLSEENARLSAEKRSLEQEIAALREQQPGMILGNDAEVQANEWNDKLGELARQRDQARADVDRLKTEVAELRNVIETHVVKLQDGNVMDANAEVQALRTELEMVRKNAAEDLSRLRSQLTIADSKGKQQDARDVDTVATVQALRQENDSMQRAMTDKDQSLRVSQSQCRSLEDAIEDRDREIDHLRRKLESLLRKTSGMQENSEMLMSQLNDLSTRPYSEAEQVTLQPTEQVTRGDRDPDLENLHTPLTRLFRKR